MRISAISACVSLVVLLWPARSFAQDSTAPPVLNSLYVEAGGSSGGFSINYDRLVAPSLFLRVGGAYIPYDWYGLWDATSILYGGAFRLSSSASTWELGGVGISMIELSHFSGGTRRIRHGGGFLFGYRYQPDDEGLVFRLTSSIVVLPTSIPGQADGLGIYIGPGASLGYTF